MPCMLDARAKLLLKTLVDRYIADGQPVGSRTLSKAEGLALSPATIRNVMADLEEQGLITSPHTSSGRIPTAHGYRLFVDTLITANAQVDEAFSPHLSLPTDQPQKALASAAQMLSSLSQFVGVVKSPRSGSVFRHIEFFRLSEKRILLIIVSPDGDVQNRVLLTQHDFTPTQLLEAGNYLNQHYSSMALEQVSACIQSEVENLQSEITQLMQTAIAASSEALDEAQHEVLIAGERNLLSVDDFSSNMEQLRRVFEMFEQKTLLVRLLEASKQGTGVRIYIGGESQAMPLEDMSAVTAPYMVDGDIVGTLGVIGPTRMPYQRVIEIVDITSRMLGQVLSQR